MKEVKLFQFENNTYDLNFIDTEVQLYVVKDLISGVMVSQIISAANDFVAVTGFKNFCDKRKEENDFNVYQLLRVGSFNLQDICIQENEKEVLFDSRNDLDKFLEEAKDYLVSQEN